MVMEVAVLMVAAVVEVMVAIEEVVVAVVTV